MEYYPDKSLNFKGVHMLAHKGGGWFDEGNTMEACIYGMEHLDGIECDIQWSADNDIWLSHSSDIRSCGSFKEKCFSSATSAYIIEVDSCLGKKVNYTQLETLFDYIHNYHPEKFISLDAKAWKPCEVAGLNMIRQMNTMAQKIIDLTIKYNLENKVMVESETGDFLYYIKKNCNFIETYLVTSGDFELGVSRALSAGFSGISFQYKYEEEITKAHIDMIHRKGVKIQLWTVNDPTDIEEAKSLMPDFIQTDNF